MASRPPGSQADDQDQQPSSSGRPPDVTVYEDSPGPAGEGAGARRHFTGSTGKEERAQGGKEQLDQSRAGAAWSPVAEFPRRERHAPVSSPSSAPSAACSSPPQRPGRKRKRPAAFRAEVDGAPAAEAQDAWVVESLSGLKMKLKRQRVFSVLPEHHEVFNRLLEDPVVKKFLAWDKKLEVSDKYLLSMVIAYFSRAGLFSWQYQRIHFFIALYVASDMEEDNQAPKQAIFSFLYGKNRSQRPLFHRLRLQFIRSMGWRTRVTREECEQVGGLWRSSGGEGCEEIQAFDPELWVWGRDRTLLP
nr:speedy protein E4-like [Kogia breviceps]